MYRRNEQKIRAYHEQVREIELDVSSKPHYAVLVFSTASGMENITNMVYKRLGFSSRKTIEQHHPPFVIGMSF